ncbi:MAG: glycosyltransferase, partial [Anaerorhabdus sp.]
FARTLVIFSSKSNVTLVITSCNRFDLLKKTLESFSKNNTYPIKEIIIIEDSGNPKIRNIIPNQWLDNTKLIINEKNLGQIKSIDLAYQEVKTDYIFHCEDDWLFDQPIQIEEYINILKNDSSATSIVLRKLSDFSFTEEEFNKIQFIQNSDITTAKLTKLHDQWHGFTFNPHISPITMWKATQGF